MKHLGRLSLSRVVKPRLCTFCTTFLNEGDAVYTLFGKRGKAFFTTSLHVQCLVPWTVQAQLRQKEIRERRENKPREPAKWNLPGRRRLISRQDYLYKKLLRTEDREEAIEFISELAQIRQELQKEENGGMPYRQEKISVVGFTDRREQIRRKIEWAHGSA